MSSEDDYRAPMIAAARATISKAEKPTPIQKKYDTNKYKGRPNVVT